MHANVNLKLHLPGFKKRKVANVICCRHVAENDIGGLQPTHLCRSAAAFELRFLKWRDQFLSLEMSAYVDEIDDRCLIDANPWNYCLSTNPSAASEHRSPREFQIRATRSPRSRVDGFVPEAVIGLESLCRTRVLVCLNVAFGRSWFYMVLELPLLCCLQRTNQSTLLP